MLCRSLHSLVFARLFLALALSLALAASASVAAPLLPQERGEATAMAFRAIEVPLVALAPDAAVFRIEKQAQGPRYVFQKPERSGRPSPADRTPPRHTWSALRHSPRLFPRRTLVSRHLALRAPSDASDPFLAFSPSS